MIKRIIYGGRSQGKTWRSLMEKYNPPGWTKKIAEEAISYAREGKLVIFGIHHDNFTWYIVNMINWLAPEEWSRPHNNVLKHSSGGEIRIKSCNKPRFLFDQELRGLKRGTKIIYDHAVWEYQHKCLY